MPIRESTMYEQVTYTLEVLQIKSYTISHTGIYSEYFLYITDKKLRISSTELLLTAHAV